MGCWATEGEKEEEDWREFRARLVQQEAWFVEKFLDFFLGEAWEKHMDVIQAT